MRNNFNERTVGLFYSRDEVEAAVYGLKDTDYDLER